jgi:hypothetical protein
MRRAGGERVFQFFNVKIINRVRSFLPASAGDASRFHHDGAATASPPPPPPPPTFRENIPSLTPGKPTLFS